MRLLTVVFSILLVSSFTKADAIHFIIGSEAQIKSRAFVLQWNRACLILHVSDKEPKNGRDDDYNGYLDDDRGFNFATGEAVKDEFTKIFFGSKGTPVACTSTTPLVIPEDSDIKLVEKIAEYITHSPLYVDALPARTDTNPLEVHLTFPVLIFDELLEKLASVKTKAVNFYFSPY